MAQFFDTVLVGGGISCLAAARSLRGDSILFERASRPGGLCRTEEMEGFAFDRTGHLLHLREPRIRRLVRRLLAGNLGRRRRNSWIHSHGVETRYPFQSHFHGLPPEVIAECLLGVIRARTKPAPARMPRIFAEWVIGTFGAGVARHFMFPYNRKLWCVRPDRLTTEWMGRFVPRPDLRRVILGAVSDFQDDTGYNASFLYPRRGGIEALVRALARGVKRMECNQGVRRVDLKRRVVILDTGDRVGFGRLVSCAPLPRLVGMLRPLPERVRRAARELRWSSVYNLNLGIRGPRSDKSWVYVPEPRFAVYRFGYASNFSDHLAPKGCVNVYTEVSYTRRRPLDREKVKNRVIDDLLSLGVLRSRRDVLVMQENDLPFAYATYDRNRTRAVATILSYLESRDVHPVGRYGRWEYGTMEDALLQGVEVADRLRKRP